ncbi:hypothetical protein ACFLTB_03115 [Chloroflexota bacterium]
MGIRGPISVKYPETVKRRAGEIAPLCRSVTNVLDALSKEFPSAQVPIDKRTISRWLKERNAHYTTNIEVHFAQLTKIATLLLENDVGKVIIIPDGSYSSERIYPVPSSTCGIIDLTQSELIKQIERNIDYVCQRYSVWYMWDCFSAHFEAEHPESADFHSYMHTQTGEFINAIRAMSERATFQGFCPVCKGWQ